MHSLILNDNNTLLMGGLQNYVAELDLTTVQETQKVRRYNTTSLIPRSNYFYIAFIHIFLKYRIKKKIHLHFIVHLFKMYI